MKRRTVLQGGLCATLSLIAETGIAPRARAEEKWPSRLVTIYVPFAAGSNTDGCARLLADSLKGAYDQPFIIENRPGAGGIIGANMAAKAPADGYKLLVAGNSSLSAAPALFKNVPYDPVKDFQPISRIGRFSSLVITTPGQPFKSMQQLVAFAKANPDKINYGYNNSAGQIVGESIKKRTGIAMTRVPYGSSAAAVSDLIGGRIQLAVADLLNAGPQISAGKVIPLATFSRDRSVLLPDVPTLSETAMPGFELVAWIGLFAPAGIPSDVVETLSDHVGSIITRSDIIKRLGAMGIEPYYAPTDETEAFVKADLPNWQDLARDAGVELQD